MPLAWHGHSPCAHMPPEVAILGCKTDYELHGRHHTHSPAPNVCCRAALPPPPSSPPPPHARTLMASVHMAGDALCGVAMPMRADGLRQGKRSVCPPNQCVWMRAISGASGRRHAQTMMWYLWQANHIRGSIVVSISACHADDPGSIPGRGVGTLTPCACGVAAMICSVLTRPGLEPGISGSGGRRLIH